MYSVVALPRLGGMAALAVAGVLAAAGLNACGGSSPSAAEKAGAAAVAARQIPQGITITHTETGPATPVGAGMPRLHTAAAAHAECGTRPPAWLSVSYGGRSTDLDSVAWFFAKRRAAPGALAVVERGCRSALHQP